MKLKIEVDLADVIENVDREYFCYDDFEKGVISSIKSSIIFETRQVILDKIKDATIKEIGEGIISNLNSISESIKTEITNEILENKEICPYQYSSQKVKAKDYIYKRLTDSANSCIEKIVKETAANICKNLKDRYDIAFATAIVDNLRKQNMLDEKVASLLLNNENK